MPKDVIDRAIKKAIGGDAEHYDEIRYEGYGPGGIAIIVEAMTDNRNRTASNVRSYFTKNGGNTGRNRVGVVHVRPGGARSCIRPRAGDADTVMMAALEAGAEDVESRRGRAWICCADTDLNEVSTALETALGEAKPPSWSGSRRTRPSLIWKRAQTLMKLIDALEDDDDVQNVTGNFDIPEDVAAALE